MLDTWMHGRGKNQISVVEEGLGGKACKEGVPEDRKAEDDFQIEVVDYEGPDPDQQE